MFNLSAFGVAYKKVNEKYNETRKNIKNFSIELEDIISDIDDLNRKSNNYVASQDNKKQNIKKTISEIRKEARDEPQCPDTPKNYEKIMSVLGKEEIIQNKIDKLNKDYRLQTTQLIKVESNIEYNSKLIKNNQHIIDAVCKDCKNNIEKIFKIDIALQEISENTTKNESIKSTVSDIEDELIDLKNKNAKIKKAKEIVRKYESSLNRYKLEKKEYDNFAEKNKLRIDMLKQQYKSISEEDNPFLSIITKNEEKQININEKLNNALNYQAYYDTLRKIFGDSGAKVDVISDIISALNSRIKYYLQKMGANYTVLFDSSFEYEFITESGNCGYSAFSSGEQKRIELATLFSFRDVLMVNSLNTNIFVVDEILDSAIDTFALQAIVNDLKQKSKNTNIFLISHRETLLDNKDLFDNIMKIQKYNRQITVSRE